MYIIGGHTGYQSLEKEVWALNTVTWDWKNLEPPEMSGAVRCLRSLHFFLLSNPSRCFSIHEISNSQNYDTDSNGWISSCNGVASIY